MKIELSLTAEQLRYLSNTLEPVTKIDATAFFSKTKEQKELTSILMKVSDTFYKKYQTVSRKPTLFEANKKYKISLLYYEANALNKFVTDILEKELKEQEKTDPYSIHSCSVVQSQIDCKL